MWFDSWSDVLRVVIVGAAAYAFLILTLRLSGKPIRGAGYGDMALVARVILEPNGAMSVIGRDSIGSGTELPDAR